MNSTKAAHKVATMTHIPYIDTDDLMQQHALYHLEHPDKTRSAYYVMLDYCRSASDWDRNKKQSRVNGCVPDRAVDMKSCEQVIDSMVSDERDGQLLKDRFVGRRTLSEMSEFYGCSESGMHSKLNRVLQKIRGLA